MTGNRHVRFHGGCGTKVRHESNERIRSLHAVSEMAEGPPKPPYRRRLQTTLSCTGQEPVW